MDMHGKTVGFKKWGGVSGLIFVLELRERRGKRDNDNRTFNVTGGASKFATGSIGC